MFNLELFFEFVFDCSVCFFTSFTTGECLHLFLSEQREKPNRISVLFDNLFRQTRIVLNNLALFPMVDSQKISRFRAYFLLEPFLFFLNSLLTLTFVFLQMLILILGSVGAKLETQLFNASHISRPKKPCRISCYFLDLISGQIFSGLNWVLLLFLPEDGDPILVLNLRQSPLEILLSLDYGRFSSA